MADKIIGKVPRKMKDYSNTRERLERAEDEIKKARLSREQSQREEDAQQRQKLERQSPRASRVNFVDLLNGQSDQRTARELPGALVLEGIRRQQDIGRKSAADHNASYAQYELKKLAEDFDRLNRSAMPVRAGGGYGEARIVETLAVKPRGNFDFDASRDPGRRQDSQFGNWQDEFAPRLTADRVRDADGSLRGGNRDHWASGDVEAVDTGWMLAEAKRLVEAVRQRSYGRGRV